MNELTKNFISRVALVTENIWFWTHADETRIYKGFRSIDNPLRLGILTNQQTII